MLAPLLPSFLVRHPRVTPEVTLGLSLVDLVREGFDVGIRVAMSASLPSSSLIAKKLGPVHTAFYASSQYAARRELPKRPQDLHDHDTIGFFPGKANVLSITSPKGTAKLEIRGRVSGTIFSSYEKRLSRASASELCRGSSREARARRGSRGAGAPRLPNDVRHDVPGLFAGEAAPAEGPSVDIAPPRARATTTRSRVSFTIDGARRTGPGLSYRRSYEHFRAGARSSRGRGAKKKRTR